MDYEEIKKTLIAGGPTASEASREQREASGAAMIELLVDMAKNLDIIARSSKPFTVRGQR